MPNPEIEHLPEEESTLPAPEAPETEVTEGEWLTPEQVAQLEETYEAERAQEGEPEMIEVDFEALDAGTQEKIEQLEGEFTEAVEQLDAEAAKSRLELLKEFGMKVAEFLDLDTKEKIMTALLEVIPYVGAVYAVVGKRIALEKGPDGIPRPKLEDLTLTDRGIYLLGEVMLSGHAMRGVKEAIASEGFKKVAKEIGKVAAERTGQMLVTRAKKAAMGRVAGAAQDIKGVTGA